MTDEQTERLIAQLEKLNDTLSRLGVVVEAVLAPAISDAARHAAYRPDPDTSSSRKAR